MKKIPFSQMFQTKQNKKIEAGVEETVFHGTITTGVTGFLGVLSSNDYEGILWSWTIDDELVEENIQHALGDMERPELLQPPYVVRNYVEVKAKNTLPVAVSLEVYCDGVGYMQETLKPTVMPPAPTMITPTMVLQEIRDEIHNKKPVGQSTDRLVNVTDSVTDVYDEQLGGLQWTTCSVVNKGPNDVYVSVNKWEAPEAGLPPGESMILDLGCRASIQKIYLKCDTGQTAQVRLHAMK